ncbi:tight junction protein ZO-1-like isoform X1 [Lytechinus pictus]|uniref:tight junction protein ZO-1-like isoform X1 n=1 Tax=Lytechinus pictus TaxID=7653 RepID=UPI0030B9DF1E
MMDTGYGGRINGHYDSGSSTLNRGGNVDVRWEKDTVSIRRAQGIGFGIAVSGGRDNPHFQSGETSIVVSDVAPNGPAEGLVKKNDRILSINGAPMENVYHQHALDSLRRGGEVATITYKRKVTGPPRISDTQLDGPDNRQSLRLSKSRSESYGIRLGYKLFVDSLNEYGVAAALGLRKGDEIIRINNTPVEQVSLADAHAIIERSRDGMDLDITRPIAADRVSIASSIEAYTAPPLLAAVSSGGAPPRPPPPDEEDEYVPPPPRPPSPGQDDFRDGIPVDPEGDAHMVSFNKGGSVGIKLIGGNEVGIYVAGIKPGSPAESSGVAIADRITCVNDEIYLQGLTKEEVALLLLTLPDYIKLEVRHSRSAFRKVMESGRGDKFYIKAHFAYENPVGEELKFPRGTVFRTVDTFPEGAMGYWYAIRLDRNNIATERGLIPNNSRATQSNMAQQSVETVKLLNTSGTRKEFFKRRGNRASMRKLKNSAVRIEIEDEYDEVVFAGTPGKFPAYERVTLGTVGFVRPVVIFGPLADIARDHLKGALPDKFENPLTEHTFDRHPGEQLKINPQGMVKMGSIKDIIDKGKHCLLDVTPFAVEQLNLMQYYPIVIFLNADSRSMVKEIRGQYMSPEQNKGSKKLYKTSLVLKKAFAHLFTAMIPLTTNEAWLQNIKDAIRIQQRKEIWMSETKYEEPEADESHLPLVGPIILPADYDTDAESIMPDSHGNSTIDSDIEQLSPTVTANTSATPGAASESSFNFNEKEVKASLPKTDPPPKRYSSDEEEYPSSFDRRRKSRSRSKKKESIWSSLRRSMSRSRSRSRDRREEAREIEREEAEEARREQEREERERMREEERNKRNTLERERMETSFEPEERPSKKDQHRRRDEAREIAEEVLNSRGKSQGQEDLRALSDTINLSTLADEFKSFGIDGDVSVNGHMEPEPQQIHASLDVEVESALPSAFRPQPQPRESKAKPIQPVVSMVQHSAPIETDLDAIDPPTDDFDLLPPAPKTPVLETTFGPEDDDDSDDDEGPPPPARMEPAPTETRPAEPASRPRRVTPMQTPESRSEPSRPRRTPNNPISKPEVRPEELSFSVEVSRPSAEKSRPKRVPTSRPSEPAVDISAPSWEIPEFQEPRQSLPPARPPPPPPEEEELPPPKPELPPPKPVEPVYSQVQKSKPSPRASPLGWDHSEVQKSKPSPRASPRGWDLPAKVEPPPPAKPAFQTSTPATSSPKWERKAEPDVQTIKVGSGYVNAEVKTVDLGGDKSEDEVSADAYRNQLAKMSNMIKRSDSPRGWSSATKSASQIRPVRAPKPPTTGQTGNAYLDSKKARDNFFNPPPEINAPPRAPGSPYDRESYKAHKERTKKRSQSPGRQYQERTGIYPPQNSYDKKKPAFKAIPVDEVALRSDEGQEVVDTVRGTFDGNGGVLDSPSTGVSIHIPKGAIPDGYSQELYFKVCRDNSMLPPLDKNKGETLLSPLVMCGPHGLKFMKPVELKLPHSASNTQEGWEFNLKSSDAGQGEPAQWKNQNIPGLKSNESKPITKTVSVMVDHF